MEPPSTPKRPFNSPTFDTDELQIPKRARASPVKTRPGPEIAEAALQDVPDNLQALYKYRDDTGERSFTMEDIDRWMKEPLTMELAARLKVVRKKERPLGLPPQLPSDPRGTSESVIRSLLLSTGIRVLPRDALIRVPPLAPVPSTWRGQPVEWRSLIGQKVPGFDKPIVDEMPNLGADKSTWVTPVWMPRYVALKYDEELFADIATFATSPLLAPETKDLLALLRADLHGLASKYYCGNGTPEGQVGRLKKVLAVASQVKEWRESKGRELSDPIYPRTQLAFSTIMSQYFPLTEVPYNLSGTPQEVRERNKAMGLPPITAVDSKSSDGIIWWSRPGINRPRQEGRKRGEVAPWDQVLADRLLMALDSEVYHDAQKIYEDFGFLALCIMKNKTEVYELAERTTKTRNYFETNGFAMMPLQMAFKATHGNLPRWDTSPVESPVANLIGFSPYLGGMDRLVRKMARTPDYAFVYADNLWITAVDEKGVRHHLSLDMDKGEANVTYDEVVWENTRTLSHFTGASAAWSRYLTVLAPMMSRRGVALFGPEQIPMDFLTTGTVATAYYNQVKSVIFLHCAKEIRRQAQGVSWEFSMGNQLGGALRRAQEISGSAWKIEATCLLSDITNPIPGKVVRLDVLGMNAMHLGKYGVDAFANVLEEERLLKALLWLKRDAKRSYPGELLNIVKYIRFRAFYLLGGWLYPGVAAFLRMKCERMLDYLQSVANLDEALFADEVNTLLAALGVEGNDPTKAGIALSLGPLLQKRAIPLPHEAIAFTCGPAAAEQFARWVRAQPNLRGHLRNWLPEELVPEGEPERQKLTPQTPIALLASFDPSLTVVTPGAEKPLRAGPGPKLTKPPRMQTVQPQPNPLMGSYMSREKWEALPEDQRLGLVSRLSTALAKALGPDPSQYSGLKLFVSPSPADRELGIALHVAFANRLSSALGVPQVAAYRALRSLGVKDTNYTEDEGEGVVNLLQPEKLSPVQHQMEWVLEAAPELPASSGRGVVNL